METLRVGFKGRPSGQPGEGRPGPSHLASATERTECRALCDQEDQGDQAYLSEEEVQFRAVALGQEVRRLMFLHNASGRATLSFAFGSLQFARSTQQRGKRALRAERGRAESQAVGGRAGSAAGE